jgi:hypothetical protein
MYSIKNEKINEEMGLKREPIRGERQRVRGDSNLHVTGIHQT